MTAMRTNLNLLDQGGPIRRHAQQHVGSSPQPFAGSSPQPFTSSPPQPSTGSLPQPFDMHAQQHGRSPPQPFVGEESSSTQPFEGFEVNMTEKRRGRKEVFENELKPCHKPGLQKAKLKELNKLVSSGAVRVLSKKESDAVRNDPN